MAKLKSAQATNWKITYCRKMENTRSKPICIFILRLQAQRYLMGWYRIMAANDSKRIQRNIKPTPSLPPSLPHSLTHWIAGLASCPPPAKFTRHDCELQSNADYTTLASSDVRILSTAIVNILFRTMLGYVGYKHTHAHTHINIYQIIDNAEIIFRYKYMWW